MSDQDIQFADITSVTPSYLHYCIRYTGKTSSVILKWPPRHHWIFESTFILAWKNKQSGERNCVSIRVNQCSYSIPDSKVHEDKLGPIWGRQDPDGPHVGPMNLAIWDYYKHHYSGQAPVLVPGIKTHPPLDKMAAISQTIFSDAFPWMKCFSILIKKSLKFVHKVLINNNPALL